MSAPHNPPFRADHVGSLLRPAALIAARTDHAAGKITAEALRAVEDAAIRDAVALQESVGLQSITDGEFRRANYVGDFYAGAFGKGGAYYVPSTTFFHHNDKGEKVPSGQIVVKAKARWDGPIFAQNIPFVKSLTSRAVKQTIPSPSYVHFFGGRAAIDRAAYPKLDAFWSDLIAVYHKEMAALSEAGCDYLQIDETSLVKFGDPEIRNILEDRGEDLSDLAAMYTDVLNAIFAKVPRGMTAGIHVCRGNNQGMWQADADYGPMADVLFRKVNARFYFLEYDTPRAGTFEALRRVPEDKTVILGLLTTKKGALESAADLERRIDEASRFIDRDRLGLCPQCGFASGLKGNDLTVAEEKAKLARVVEVAREVWGEA